MHKRKGVIFFALACVSVAVALLGVVWTSHRFDTMIKARQITFEVEQGEPSVPVLGSGVNLAQVPTSNLLKDASFDPYVFKKAVTVLDGTQDKIIISNAAADPGVYGEGFFVGGKIRVNSFSQEGVSLKKTGTVVRYSPNLAGDLKSVPVTGDIPEGAKVSSFARKGEEVILAGENGIVLTGANTQSPEVHYVGIGEDIAGACADSNEFYICTVSGVFYSSPNGTAWTRWESLGEVKVNSIAASSNLVIGVGDEGKILLGSEQTVTKRDLGLESDITDIIHDGSKFVAVTSSGEILLSYNGIYWETTTPFEVSGYVSIDYHDSTYVLLTDNNRILVFDDIRSDPVSEELFETDIIDIAVLSKSKIMGLAKDNTLFDSADLGINWEMDFLDASEDMTGIYSVGDHEILFTSVFINTHISSLVTEITIDSSLTTGTFEPGDICYLSIEYPYPPETLLDKSGIDTDKVWEFYGSGSAERIISENSSEGGVGKLKIEHGDASDNRHPYSAISQRIGFGQPSKSLIPGEFYELSIWMAGDEIADGTVIAWISGAFEPIGTEFRNVGESRRKYTFRFSFPPSITIIQATQARLNIGIKDRGTVYIDKVKLTKAQEKETRVSLGFKESLKSMEPGIMRLEYLGIGSLDIMPNRWARDNNLEYSLNMVSDTGENTSPWIVIDSAVSESELRNLIEYLCGPITSVYGRMRLESGSSIPWINKFDKIFFEFTDSENIYGNDVYKAAFVNYLIDTVEKTPYYSDNRNKMLFVDGNYYNEGIMLSRADYSASDLNWRAEETRYSSVKNALAEYRTVIPRNPDRPGTLPLNLLRSTEFKRADGEVDTATFTAILLEMMGTDTAASLATVKEERRQDNYPALTTAIRTVSAAAKGEKIKLAKSQTSEEDIHVFGYAFRENNKEMYVFISLDDEPSSVILDVHGNYESGVVTKWDAGGRHEENYSMARLRRGITILPGHIITVEITRGE